MPDGSTGLRRRLASLAGRVRTTPGAQDVATPAPAAQRPVLSVVVLVRGCTTWLASCLESLEAQTLEGIEILVVDDGSVEGVHEVSAGFAARHPATRVVAVDSAAGGPARETGVAVATGEFLAFCDGGDEVPPGAYERLVTALRGSGSDLAVGAVALWVRGGFSPARWNARSNPERRLGIALEAAPGLFSNHVLGARVFRRSWWDEVGLGVAAAGDGETQLVTRSLLAARSIDIVAAVTYRVRRGEDETASLREDLLETPRIRARFADLAGAAELVRADPRDLHRELVVQALDGEVPDLVRAAVTHGPGPWAALVDGLRTLMGGVDVEVLGDVPVEERVTAWVCAHAERSVAESWLQHLFDNPRGLPVEGHGDELGPVLPWPATDDDRRIARIAEVDRVPRSRLTAVRWTAPGVLRVEGAAFFEYVAGPALVSLVVRDGNGQEVSFPTEPLVDEGVNLWAARPHEDRSDAAFAGELDCRRLEPLESGGDAPVVRLRLQAGGSTRELPFLSRWAGGPLGLLEGSSCDATTVVPAWETARGLVLRRSAESPAESPGTTPADVTGATALVVQGLVAAPDVLELECTTDRLVELALVGPRARTSWVTAETPAGSVRLELCADPWGLGSLSLPSDVYDLVAREPGGADVPVRVAPDLWRTLPELLRSTTHLLQPRVVDDGRLQLVLGPAEQADRPGASGRRRRQREHYAAARDSPLLDVVLFEAFGGRTAGDSPGAICAELAGRDTGLDLAFSVVDRSVPVPAGARQVVRWSAEWFELLARARYLVTNAVLPAFFDKRPGQRYLQTWHGTPLKRIGHDRISQDFADWRHRRQLLDARKHWDLLVSQSPFCSDTLRQAFRYEGEVLESGYPRNDVLVAPGAEDLRRRTRERLGIAPDAHVVLYTPTWRDNQRSAAAYAKVVHLDTGHLLHRLPDTVVLVRGHYTSMKERHLDGDGRVRDVTGYPDVGDLYAAADALVTDYSSTFFDFALTGRPMYFLAPDLEEYAARTRGFYLDYHRTVPGPVATTTEGLVDAMAAVDDYAERRRRFVATYAPWDDGQAAVRAVDALLR